MTHCSRPVDPPPEDLLPEYITIEELGEILEGGSQMQPNAPPSKEQKESMLEFMGGPADSQPHISSIQSKKSVLEIDLTEDECAEVQNIEEEFTIVSETAQSPRSSCSESELQIDISEHDVHMSLNEQDLNQLTSQSYKAEFQCETCPYETDIRENFEVHLKVHRTVFACDWCHYITKSKIKLKNHQVKRHKPLISHLMITCLYCDFATSTERNLKSHLLNIHQKCFRKNRKKSEVDTLPEVVKPIADEVCRPDSPYSEPRLQIDLGYSVEYPQSNCSDSEAQIDFTEHEMSNLSEPKPQSPYIEPRLQIDPGNSVFEKQNSQSICIDITKQQTIKLDEPKPLFIEPSTNNILLEQADIKVEYPEELVETTERTQLTSQSRKAQFQCDICPYESDFQDQFEVHQKVHVTVYTCPLCKYRTSSKVKLTIHQSVKCRNSPQKLEFDCPNFHCTFSASVLADLKDHWRNTHHNSQLAQAASARFCCKICRKRLDSQTTVDEHMWRHAFIRIAKNRNKLKCPKCDFIQRSIPAMRNHYSAIHRGCPHYDPNNVEELQAAGQAKVS